MLRLTAAHLVLGPYELKLVAPRGEEFVWRKAYLPFWQGKPQARHGAQELVSSCKSLADGITEKLDRYELDPDKTRFSLKIGK